MPPKATRATKDKISARAKRAAGRSDEEDSDTTPLSVSPIAIYFYCIGTVSSFVYMMIIVTCKYIYIYV